MSAREPSQPFWIVTDAAGVIQLGCPGATRQVAEAYARQTVTEHGGVSDFLRREKASA